MNKLRGPSDGSGRGVSPTAQVPWTREEWAPPAPGGTLASAYTREDAPPGHLLAQPDVVALPDVPVLLQVLRVRDAPGASVRAGGGPRDPRRRSQAAGQGATRADRRAPRGEPRGRRAPARVRPRGLHGVRGVGM